MKTLSYFFLMVLLVCSVSYGKVVTLVVSGSTGSKTFSVGSNEVVRVLSFPPSNTGETRLTIHKSQIDIYSRSSANQDASDTPKVIAGPCEIFLHSVNSGSGFGSGYVTLEVTPDFFPPDRTVLIPEGGTAQIALQCSTNLVTWTNVFSAGYTNVPSHKFFRICLERLP